MGLCTMTRYDTKVLATELETGDRIARRLVAPDGAMLGKPLYRPPDNAGDEPDTQLVRVTAIRSMDDSHAAIILDPESGLFIRASRLDKRQAWTQAEADWTVGETGEDVVVEKVHELDRPEGERDETEVEYVQTWVEILFDEIRYSGDTDLRDERELDGRTLKLNDFDGRRAVATISLE